MSALLKNWLLQAKQKNMDQTFKYQTVQVVGQCKQQLYGVD